MYILQTLLSELKQKNFLVQKNRGTWALFHINTCSLLFFHLPPQGNHIFIEHLGAVWFLH
jgi:hypothetical protein